MQGRWADARKAADILRVSVPASVSRFIFGPERCHCKGTILFQFSLSCHCPKATTNADAVDVNGVGMDSQRADVLWVAASSAGAPGVFVFEVAVFYKRFNP